MFETSVVFFFFVSTQNDPVGYTRHEDHLVAWSWDQYIEFDNDPEVLVQLPMTKVSSSTTVTFGKRL